MNRACVILAAAVLLLFASAALPETMAELDSTLDWMQVSVEGIVTYLEPDECYIEAADRCGGIWTQGPTAGFEIGDPVIAFGTLGNVLGEPVILDASIFFHGRPAPIRPFGMANDTVGGASKWSPWWIWDFSRKKVLEGHGWTWHSEWVRACGASNTGLLVKTCGTVYVTDNSGFYPTNRPRLSGGQLALIMPTVNLSPPAPIPPATEPSLHRYGPNWVEALYPYLQSAAEKTSQDWKSFRKCPNASTLRVPPVATANCFMTYTFNRCLVEQYATVARNRKKLMMMREFSRMTVSTLRPANDCTANYQTRPVDPFLNNHDYLVPGANTGHLLHSGGSYVVFADGHVKAFDISYFATDPPNYNTSASTYDWSAIQWYNYYFANPTTPDRQAKNKSIAISP